MNELSINDSDNLADIIWWFKGYNAARGGDGASDIAEDHIESLRRCRIYILELEDKKKEKKG